jgi:hypothetical protein
MTRGLGAINPGAGRDPPSLKLRLPWDARAARKQEILVRPNMELLIFNGLQEFRYVCPDLADSTPRAEAYM